MRFLPEQNVFRWLFLIVFLEGLFFAKSAGLEEEAKSDGGGVKTGEEGRAKGIILIAPDFLSFPLNDPWVRRFFIHPLARLALSHFCD